MLKTKRNIKKFYYKNEIQIIEALGTGFVLFALIAAVVIAQTFEAHDCINTAGRVCL